MAGLICNLPSIEVWVRKEYLRDLDDGFGEFEKGVWVTAKSIPGRAFYFETYLPDYGALFDKLPISMVSIACIQITEPEYLTILYLQRNH